MLLSAVSVLVVAQSSSEIPEGLMNNLVYQYKNIKIKLYKNNAAIWYNKTCRIEFSLNLCTGRPLTDRTIPDAASIKFSLLMMSM